MAKLANATLSLFIFLLLASTLTFAARSDAALATNSPAKTQADQGVEAEIEVEDVSEDSCEGVGEEECLMRRTLAAQGDYSTSRRHPPPHN